VDVRRERLAAMRDIRLARVYDEAPHDQSATFLVERLWPRGLRRDALHVDAWCRDVAPTTELRKWFSHDPLKWPEFQRRYVRELDANPQAWQPLVEAAQAANITLLYSSRDREHNNAVVLRDYLLAHLRNAQPRSGRP
jgi:uncharacterized protein YeaO (DUF488 family)